MFQVPDWRELHHMANSLAGRIFEASFGQDYYTIGDFINIWCAFKKRLNVSGTASDIQYSATGGSDDWARGVAGIKWVWIIDGSDKSTSQWNFVSHLKILPFQVSKYLL